MLKGYQHALKMNQLEKLQAIAGQENKLTKHEVFIKGHDLSFWSRPMKISEYQMAKKQSKDPDDLLESTARLFIKKALDANGVPQYQIDALPVIMGALSMETASKLLRAMNESDEEEELNLDFKSAEEAPKKGARSAA